MFTNGYPWPASRLGEKEMKILYQLRLTSGIPITRILSNLVRNVPLTTKYTGNERALRYINKRLEILNQEYKLDKEHWYDIYPTIGKIKELLAVKKLLNGGKK